MSVCMVVVDNLTYLHSTTSVEQLLNESQHLTYLVVLSRVCAYAVVTCLCAPLNEKAFSGRTGHLLLLWPQRLHKQCAFTIAVYLVVDYSLCLSHLHVWGISPVPNSHRLNFRET